MNLIYFGNILFFIFLSYYPVYYQSRYFKLGLINPISIPFFIGMPVMLLTAFAGPLIVLESGLFNDYFQYALLMTNLYQLSAVLFIVLLFALFRRIKWMSADKINLIQPFKIKRKRMFFVAGLSMCVYLVSFLLLSREFGPLNWILNPREGYQYHRAGVGLFYAMSISSLSLAYAILMIFIRSRVLLYILTLIFLPMVFLLGSKALIISLITFFIVVLWLKKAASPLTLTFFILLGFIGMLVNFYLSSRSYNLMGLFSYFDHYVNSAMYYREFLSGNIDLYFGQIRATGFWNFVPRLLYPDKPYVYGITIINELFWPGAAAATHTPAFGGPVAAYADFGVLGVLMAPFFSLSSIIALMLNYLLYKDLKFDEVVASSNRLLLFIWCLAPSFMLFFPFPANIVSFLILFWLIGVVNRLTYK